MSWHWLIIALLVGFVGGAFVFDRTTYNAYIKRIKQRGRNNAQDVVFKPNYGTSDENGLTRKETRIARRLARKEKRNIN